MNEELKNQKERGRYALSSNLWGLLLVGVLLLIDMVTKIVADAYFENGEMIRLIPGYLELCISYNEGIAFSIGSNAPLPAKIALVAGTGVLFVGLLVFYFLLDKRRSWLRISLLFIVAGGVGNFIDRLFYLYGQLEGVRDMVFLNFAPFFQDILGWNVSDRFLNFGVCNFADFFIVGGAIALMLAILFFDGAAIYPLTKKYKDLAKELEEKEEEKKQAKARK